MKKICYFKRGEPVPKNATFLCYKKRPIKNNSAVPEYEELFVYEIKVDVEKLAGVKNE